MSKKQLLLCAALTFFSCHAIAQTVDDAETSPNAARADDHAPIGVMGDHTHHAGEFMFGYRYERMDMNGNLVNSTGVSPEAIAMTPSSSGGMGMMGMGQGGAYRAVPLNMTMDMHMLEAMYAPTDWVTLMVMGQIMTNDMTERSYMGNSGIMSLGDTGMRTTGFGDTSVSALFPIVKNSDFEFNVMTGVSIPTGSIIQSGPMLMQDGANMAMRYGYAMQLGSGTWDVLPGFTVKGRDGLWGWGVQYRAAIRTGVNTQGYRLGDTHMLTGWGSYEITDWLSSSFRLVGSTTDSIHGSDRMIMMSDEQANTALYGGQRLDALIGFNTVVQDGSLKGFRFGVEGGAPVYQRLNGPQMAGAWEMIFGVQRAF